MPICKGCKEHFLNCEYEICGRLRDMHEELPSLYHRTPTCPICGLIGEIKSSKLRDALAYLKKQKKDEKIIMEFMRFYRKRNKDFNDGISIVKYFLKKVD